MTLFICILCELIAATLGFFYLSSKYQIKFQISQVVVHMAMIFSISISKFTGWFSEAMNVSLANEYR